MIVYYLNVPGNNRRIWWVEQRIVPLEVINANKSTLVARVNFKNGAGVNISFNTDQKNKAYFNSHIEALCAIEALVNNLHLSTKKNRYYSDSMYE